MAFFLIYSMVLGLFDQVQILSQLHLIELLGILTGLGLLKQWHLIYPRLLTGFSMLVYFTKLRLMEFQIRYFVLFLLFLLFISSFLSNRELRVVLDGKSSQEYPVKATCIEKFIQRQSQHLGFRW